MKFNIFSIFSYAWKTKKVWWYTSLARTKARFARTTIGGFWLGLSNLLSIAALSSVYGIVLEVDNFREYIVYLGLGLVCWNAVASAFATAPILFVTNSNQILNTNTNHFFYTLEEWAFSIQTFFQSFIMVLIGLSFIKFDLILNLFTAGLLPLINLIIFLYWFPVFISIAGIRYRDFYQLIPVLIQMVFLLSPFLYEKKVLGSLSWTAEVNPLYQVVACLRESLINNELPLKSFSIIFLLNLIGTYISMFMLHRTKKILPFLI